MVSIENIIKGLNKFELTCVYDYELESLVARLVVDSVDDVFLKRFPQPFEIFASSNNVCIKFNLSSYNWFE